MCFIRYKFTIWCNIKTQLTTEGCEEGCLWGSHSLSADQYLLIYTEPAPGLQPKGIQFIPHLHTLFTIHFNLLKPSGNFTYHQV
jgi:hypothetical protein